MGVGVKEYWADGEIFQWRAALIICHEYGNSLFHRTTASVDFGKRRQTLWGLSVLVSHSEGTSSSLTLYCLRYLHIGRWRVRRVVAGNALYRVFINLPQNGSEARWRCHMLSDEGVIMRAKRKQEGVRCVQACLAALCLFPLLSPP